jgi:predicted kinase
VPLIEDAVRPGPLLSGQLAAGAVQGFAERRAPSRHVIKRDRDGVLDETGDRGSSVSIDEPAHAIDGGNRQCDGDFLSLCHTNHHTVLEAVALPGDRSPFGDVMPYTQLDRPGTYGRAVARLIHLNGPPAVGKSTLARRYATDHPGTLMCDVDVLRTMIGGWQHDEEAAGLTRTVALAMIAAYLGTDHDVVLPQLVARTDQLDRFRTAATQAGAEYVHVMLVADPRVVVQRFRRRSEDQGDEWAAYATQFWDSAGGDEALRAWTARLEHVDPAAARVPTTDPDETYAAVLGALDPRS